MAAYIFIDDERSPVDVTWLKLPKPAHWHVCRSYNGFVKLLESLVATKEEVAFVSFDHDLGLPKDGGEEKTGLHCATYLGEWLCENHRKMVGYKVHSQNPVGKTNIEERLKFYERWTDINSGVCIK